MHQNYKEVKNLVHNEMGICKDDIKSMISATVKEAVEEMLKSGQLDRTIESVVKGQLLRIYGHGIGSTFRDNIKREIIRQAATSVMDRLKLDVELTEPSDDNKIDHPFTHFVDQKEGL